MLCHGFTLKYCNDFTALWILSGTTRVSQYHKGKTNLNLLEQQIVSGSGISWAICKSAPRPRQITTPATQHSVFYRSDALPAANQQHQSTEGTGVTLKNRTIHFDCFNSLEYCNKQNLYSARVCNFRGVFIMHTYSVTSTKSAMKQKQPTTRISSVIKTRQFTHWNRQYADWHMVMTQF